jgi:hypothetical protein
MICVSGDVQSCRSASLGLGASADSRCRGVYGHFDRFPATLSRLFNSDR